MKKEMWESSRRSEGKKEEKMKKSERISVKRTAKLLTTSLQNIRELLKLKLVPWGIALEGESGKFRYIIFRRRLYAYLAGRDMALKLFDELMMKMMKNPQKKEGNEYERTA